jgi:hypothetical protein
MTEIERRKIKLVFKKFFNIGFIAFKNNKVIVITDIEDKQKEIEKYFKGEMQDNEYIITDISQIINFFDNNFEWETVYIVKQTYDDNGYCVYNIEFETEEEALLFYEEVNDEEFFPPVKTKKLVIKK